MLIFTLTLINVLMQKLLYGSECWGKLSHFFLLGLSVGCLVSSGLHSPSVEFDQEEDKGIQALAQLVMIVCLLEVFD